MLLQPIIQNIDHSLHQLQKPEKKAKPAITHLFLDFIQSEVLQVSAEEKMQMSYIFNYRQKVLHSSRHGNLNKAKFWLDYTNNLALSFSPVAQKIVDAFYFPVLAYYLYAQKEYTEAVEGLKRNIELLNELEAEGFQNAIWGKTEETLNIARAYFTMKDQENACKYGTQLLLFLSESETSNEVIKGSTKALEDNRVFQKQMIHFYTNALLRRINHLAQEEESDRWFTAFYQPLWANNDWTKCPIPGYAQALKILQAHYHGHTESFLQNLQEIIPMMHTVPSLMQWDILESLKIIAREEQYENFDQLSEKIENYYTNDLKLASLFPETGIPSKTNRKIVC